MVLAVIVGAGRDRRLLDRRHWRGWVADVGLQAINQGIDQSDLPPQEKVEVKEQVERVAKAFGNGEISNEQAMAIIEKLIRSRR